VAAEDAAALLAELSTLTIASCMVGEVVDRMNQNIIVYG